MDKRVMAVNVKLSERDWKLIERAAAKLWPDAIMSKSSTVLSLALMTAREILSKKPKS